MVAVKYKGCNLLLAAAIAVTWVLFELDQPLGRGAGSKGYYHQLLDKFDFTAYLPHFHKWYCALVGLDLLVHLGDNYFTRQIAHDNKCSTRVAQMCAAISLPCLGCLYVDPFNGFLFGSFGFGVAHGFAACYGQSMPKLINSAVWWVVASYFPHDAGIITNFHTAAWFTAFVLGFKLKDVFKEEDELSSLETFTFTKAGRRGGSAGARKAARSRGRSVKQTFKGSASKSKSKTRSKSRKAAKK